MGPDPGQFQDGIDDGGPVNANGMFNANRLGN